MLALLARLPSECRDRVPELTAPAGGRVALVQTPVNQVGQRAFPVTLAPIAMPLPIAMRLR
ncbi:MAG: hypothetical protein AB7P40_17590 [Chloroflexota bacterium]